MSAENDFVAQYDTLLSSIITVVRVSKDFGCFRKRDVNEDLNVEVENKLDEISKQYMFGDPCLLISSKSKTGMLSISLLDSSKIPVFFTFSTIITSCKV